MRQSDNQQTIQLNTETPVWHINTGSKKIHVKRTTGRFRNIKWLSSSVWLMFFLGPYLRWDDRQAVLFDIPARQFHLFSLTVHPSDFWLLSIVLLLSAMLLAIATVLAGRVFCGYFCFQTVWTDIFTLIETRLEGSPRDRVALDTSPWNLKKIVKKLSKHSLWLMIAMLTGISFAAWFTDVYQLWRDYIALQAHISAWVVLLLFTVGTYILAGFMREQVCFWLCPYARIQGVLYDKNTRVPAYDDARGEPRAKLDRANPDTQIGCIDCDQCVAVCPTGVDIREGQQIGCITCGLCIDACDNVMDRINQPRGLIRYESLNGLQNIKSKPWYSRANVLMLLSLIIFCVTAIGYGISTISETELNVTHRRQPAFVIMNDASIQNAYRLKVFNKTDTQNLYSIDVSGLNDFTVSGNEHLLRIESGSIGYATLYVRYPQDQLSKNIQPITFKVRNLSFNSAPMEYRSVFIAPYSFSQK